MTFCTDKTWLGGSSSERIKEQEIGSLLKSGERED